jgi:hypothetical protein
VFRKGHSDRGPVEQRRLTVRTELPTGQSAAGETTSRGKYRRDRPGCAGAALGIAAQAVLVVGRVPVRPPAARHGARRCRRGSGNSSGSACRNRRNRGPHACCAPERRCAEFGVAKSRIPLARSSLFSKPSGRGTIERPFATPDRETWIGTFRSKPRKARPTSSYAPTSPKPAPPLPSTLAAPKPRFEIENLRRGALPDPRQRLRRQQRDVMAGGTIDLDEVTLAEILDPPA